MEIPVVGINEAGRVSNNNGIPVTGELTVPKIN